MVTISKQSQTEIAELSQKYLDCGIPQPVTDGCIHFVYLYAANL